jgi:hypothetical protein
MKTDRELLEQVAKVIGIPIAFGGPDADICRRTDTWVLWNPITNDGDALRLASFITSYGFDFSSIQPAVVAALQHKEDTSTAIRMAIVNAAATIK